MIFCRARFIILVGIVLGALSCAWAGLLADDLNMKLKADLRNAYVSSGGSVVETEPVSAQSLSAWYDLHEYGRIGGYFWTISSLCGQKDDVRRRLFHEIETAPQYGYTYKFCSGLAIDTEIANIFNPTIGYDDFEAKDTDMIINVIQSLENPYVTPYYDFKGEYYPNNWIRCATGIRHAFLFFDGRLSVMPFWSVIWGDNNRYEMKFEQESESMMSFFGFTAMYSWVGIRCNYKINDYWSTYLRLQQYDIIDPAGRKHESEKDVPWAVCDYPLVVIGAALSF